MLVVGPRDGAEGTVSVRDRIDGDLGAMPLAAAIAKLPRGSRHEKDPPGRQVVKPAAAAEPDTKPNDILGRPEP